MFCKYCMKEIDNVPSVCLFCSYSYCQSGLQNNFIYNKSFYTLILCIFFGQFGLHRLYVGKLKSGILMLFSTLFSILLYYSFFVIDHQKHFVILMFSIILFILLIIYQIIDISKIISNTFTDNHGKILTL